MGEFVRYLSKISRNYDIYCVVVVSNYGNTAEQVIDRLFEKLASDIGPHAVVSKIIGGGVGEAEEKFGINYGMQRPVLVITQIHPNDWRTGDLAIRLALGKLRDENEIGGFLFGLMKLLSSDDFGRTSWQARVESIQQMASKLPISVDIAGLKMLDT
jgi:hypothetical protein